MYIFSYYIKCQDNNVCRTRKKTKEKDVKGRRTHRQTKQQDTGIKKTGKGLNNCIHCKKEK